MFRLLFLLCCCFFLLTGLTSLQGPRLTVLGKTSPSWRVFCIYHTTRCSGRLTAPLTSIWGGLRPPDPHHPPYPPKKTAKHPETIPQIYYMNPGLEQLLLDLENCFCYQTRGMQWNRMKKLQFVLVYNQKLLKPRFGGSNHLYRPQSFSRGGFWVRNPILKSKMTINYEKSQRDRKNENFEILKLII